MKLLRLALIVVLAVGSAACGEHVQGPHQRLADHADRSGAPFGRISARGPARQPATPAAQSCADLQWKITSQTGSQASGDFAATCADGIKLAGTLTATHSDTTIPWAATGTATKGATTCPFNMTGTGTFQGTSNIVLNYAGTTTCLGPFSGSETIKADALRDRDVLVQVDVLDGVEQLHAFLHRTLKRLAARDQTHPAGALVDHRRLHRFLQIAFTR